MFLYWYCVKLFVTISFLLFVLAWILSVLKIIITIIIITLLWHNAVLLLKVEHLCVITLC